MNALATVTRATRKRDAAFDGYIQAIRAARDAGHTLEAIGQAAGLTKNGVRYLLYPDPRKGK